MKIIIDCVSDLHGSYPKLPGGDLLIVAGDCTARDKIMEWAAFFAWLKLQDYKKKIIVAGNHDGFLASCATTDEEKKTVEEIQKLLKQEEDYIDESDDFVYLCDNFYEYEGIKIWGSPWTPKFGNWHFMKKRGDEINEKWKMIPRDTQILITHGPPAGLLDFVDEENAGCVGLMHRIDSLKQLKLNVFGHIHEGAGYAFQNGKLFVNASHMNGDYKPVNKPIRVILHREGETGMDLRLESCFPLE